MIALELKYSGEECILTLERLEMSKLPILGNKTTIKC